MLQEQTEQTVNLKRCISLTSYNSVLKLAVLDPRLVPAVWQMLLIEGICGVLRCIMPSSKSDGRNENDEPTPNTDFLCQLETLMIPLDIYKVNKKHESLVKIRSSNVPTIVRFIHSVKIQHITIRTELLFMLKCSPKNNQWIATDQ